MEFKFWRRARGDSPPEEYLAELGGADYGRIANKLRIIQKYGFAVGMRSQLFKKVKLKSVESLYQINADRYRILFVMRDGIGWILDAFMKTSKGDEEKHYQAVAKRLTPKIWLQN